MDIYKKVQIEKYAQDFAKLYKNYKVKEKDYEELKDIYKLIFEFSPNGIVLINEKNMILDYNKSFLEITGKDEIREKKINVIFPELKSICENEEDTYIEELILEKKKELVVSVKINHIFNKDIGGIIKVLILEDKTNRRKLQEQKKQFVSLVKHEINTPINSIVGFLGVLKNLMDKEEDKEIRDIFDYIEKSSLRLSNTVVELLKTAELMSEKVKIKKELVTISNLILEIIDERKNSILEKKIKIDFREESNIQIKGDKSLLKIAIDNLVNNAIVFNKKMGKVKIKTKNEDGKYKISISDEGEGFSKRDEKYLGQPFFQMEDYKTRKKQGLGLGISSAKRIIELHGGKIYFVSELNKGTSVIIEFLNNEEDEKEKSIEAIKKDYEKKLGEMEKQVLKYAEDLVKVYKLKN